MKTAIIILAYLLLLVVYFKYDDRPGTRFPTGFLPRRAGRVLVIVLAGMIAVMALAGLF